MENNRRKLLVVSLTIILFIVSLSLLALQPALSQTYEKQARTLKVYHGILDVGRDSTASLTFTIPPDGTNAKLQGSWEGHGGNQILRFSVSGNCRNYNDLTSCQQPYASETKSIGNVYINLDPGKTYVVEFRNPPEWWGLAGVEKQATVDLDAYYDQLVLSSSSSGTQKSGCLIATAAFGSELTPQVQQLREFRDAKIVSTASGTSFMNAFNAVYYSFSPQVAAYESGQPWLQGTVRAAIYPLLGILQVSQIGYSAVPGEYGAITAGVIASSLIGFVYFAPIALAIRMVREARVGVSIVLLILASSMAAVVASILISNSFAMMITTSNLVVSTIITTAIYSANRIIRITSILPMRNTYRS